MSFNGGTKKVILTILKVSKGFPFAALATKNFFQVLGTGPAQSINEISITFAKVSRACPHFLRFSKYNGYAFSIFIANLNVKPPIEV